MTNDKNLLEFDKEMKNGGHIDFYIDNIVDTKIELLQQMQLPVFIPSRPDIFERHYDISMIYYLFLVIYFSRLINCIYTSLYHVHVNVNNYFFLCDQL